MEVRATVLIDFYDAESRGLKLEKGTTITRPKERIDYLSKRGLVEIVEEKKADKVEAQTVKEKSKKVVKSKQGEK
ncbi:hypothetical protein [Dysgonomonas massiliensis]|uniref:hypothetical protein n=1 Tax=Dysgonomonas massiliensis TaxID=2040292 RepID=UPI000C75F4DD|nr:hypothetical protein [Dysgonomonas massiliensis]